MRNNAALDYYGQLWVIPLMAFGLGCAMLGVLPCRPVLEDDRTEKQRDLDFRHSMERLDPYGTWSYMWPWAR